MNGVDKIYKVEGGPRIFSESVHVYLISSDLILLKRVLDQMDETLKIKKDTQFHIILVPKVMVTFYTLLEEMGLCELVTLHSFAWEFIQIDTGILSLELPNFFSEVFVNGDLSLLPSLTYSLRTLFCITGQPKLTITVGNLAPAIVKQLDFFTDNLGCPPKNESQFDLFLIFDRSTDYISPLMTSATYSALLSEAFTVNCGVVEIEQANASKPNLINMDSENDEVYSNIKNLHISEVFDILSNRARQLKSETVAPKDMAISEMKDFVQTKLQKLTAKLKFLGTHLEACERIIKSFGSNFEKLKNIEQSCLHNVNKTASIREIEDSIILDSEQISMKLFCLISLTQKLSLDESNSLRLQYLHRIGYQYLHMFHNLNFCGMMPDAVKSKLPTLNLPLSGKKDFYYVANKFNLIPPKLEEINVRVPTCPSYVFGGCYIPLIAQLITYLVQAQSDTELKNKLDLVNGSIINKGLSKPFPLQRKSIILCVVGGVTYAEIAALDLVEKLYNCKIVISSNSVISGNDLIDANKK